MIETLKSGKRYTIKVKPRSKTEEIIQDGEKIIIKVKAPATDNQANEAVIKLLKKELNLCCEIVRGHTSSIKQILVLGPPAPKGGE